MSYFAVGIINAFLTKTITNIDDFSAKDIEKACLPIEELADQMAKLSDEELKEYINELERAVDNIDRHLADFLLHAETGNLTYTDRIRYNQIIRAIKDIERIGDYGENLLNFYSNMYEKKEKPDKIQTKELTKAHAEAITIIAKTLETYQNRDKKAALAIIQERRDYIKELEDYQNAYFVRETNKGKKGPIERSSYLSLVYVDILNSYERVYAHCSNIAKLYNSDKDPNRYAKTDEHRFQEMSSRY